MEFNRCERCGSFFISDNNVCCKCGPKDIIQHEQNGLLVKNGDIPGLAEAMMKVMGDEALRKRMSEEAKKVTETYSEEKVMKQWVELFEGLVRK
jgi:glycosyltransferase involved in cell wall biosynthesis